MRKRMVTRAFVIAAAAGAIALAAAVGQASPARGSAGADCSSLRNVDAFTGWVSESVGTAASGTEDPTGDLTIQIAAVAVHVRLNLNDKHHAGHIYSFGGGMSGGHVSVADSYADTGGNYFGDLKYGGSLTASGGGNAELLIDFHTCRYKLWAAFIVDGTYTGDPEVDYGHELSFGATSSDGHLTQNLTAHNSEMLDTYADCRDPFASAGGCAQLYDAWMPELILLTECHTTNTSVCQPQDNNPKFTTPASFTLSLKPVFAKKKKK